MLRGLDTSRGSDDVPIMIKVAGRTELAAGVTVYVRETAASAERERQAVVREEMDRLESAGVLEDVAVVAWSDVPAGERYAEFVEAVGADALEPSFEERADGTVVELPAVCVAIRENGELTGLYPQYGDVEQTVGDCVRALCAGDRVANVRN